MKAKTRTHNKNIYNSRAGRSMNILASQILLRSRSCSGNNFYYTAITTNSFRIQPYDCRIHTAMVPYLFARFVSY